MVSCSVFKRLGVVSSEVSRAALVTLVLAGLLSPQAARAEGASGLQDIGSGSSSDPFSTRGDNSSGVMQLIHRVMQGEGNIDRAEQRAAQQENVNEATSDFFTKQRERMKAAATAGSNPVGAPTTLPGSISVSPSPVSGSSGLNPQGSASPLIITAPAVPPAPVVMPVQVPQATAK
jgi:hypothetical protein